MCRTCFTGRYGERIGCVIRRTEDFTYSGMKSSPTVVLVVILPGVLPLTQSRAYGDGVGSQFRFGVLQQLLGARNLQGFRLRMRYWLRRR